MPEIIVDDLGKWMVFENGNRGLIEPSQKWLDTNAIEEPIQQPTETEILTDYIVDVDYRVTMIELGLL